VRGFGGRGKHEPVSPPPEPLNNNRGRDTGTYYAFPFLLLVPSQACYIPQAPHDHELAHRFRSTEGERRREPKSKGRLAGSAPPVDVHLNSV
jgi:hypothetical protein